MKAFLEKLERAAERWVQRMDGQLQDTTIQTITCQVFTHDRAVRVCFKKETDLQVTPITAPTPHSTPEPTPTGPKLYPPVLKKVRVSQR